MNDIQKGRMLDRRTALPLIIVGLGGLPAVAAGCTTRYEVETPKVGGNSTVEVQRQIVSYYDRQSQAGERITDRSTGEARLMYVNPVSSKTLLDESTLLYRDFSIVRRVSSGSGYGTIVGDVSFPNRQMVLIIDESTQSLEPNSFAVAIANSRGSTNIGKHKVYNVQELSAEVLFHPDQLNQADKNRRALVFDVEIEGKILGGATEEGENVWRVLNNDYQVVVEQKNPVSGIFDRKDIYRIKAPE